MKKNKDKDKNSKDIPKKNDDNYVALSSKSFNAWFKKYFFHFMIASLLLILFMVFFWQSISITIMPGERGVLFKRFGGGTQLEMYYPEGFHMILPWDKIYIYNTRYQEERDTVHVLSKDGLIINVDYSVLYRPNLEYTNNGKVELSLLHQEVGHDYVGQVIIPMAQANIRAIIGTNTQEDLYREKSDEIQYSLYEKIRLEISDKHIEFNKILIRKIELPVSIKDAIENKLVQEQKQLEFDFRIQVAEKEAERKRIEANGIEQFTKLSKIDIMKWRGLEVTEQLAKSPNSKIILIGTDNKLPIILSAGDDNPSVNNGGD